jgi:NADPH:quinone reductase-like Zn-dependent oxidoreductase
MKPEYLTDRLGANLGGMLAQYAVLSKEAVVHVPAQLSFEEAATLPCAAVTARVALTGRRRVTTGDAVLTQGSGGVSVFALQFARLLGARVIATTSTAEKAERLKALGASDVVNYTATPNWDAKVPAAVTSIASSRLAGQGRLQCHCRHWRLADISA